MQRQTEFLVIDVDTGIDDALALLYACAEPHARVLGVSTVVGNVSLLAATRNTRAVLALAGRSDIPVWPGAATPLSNFAADASAVHGETGLGHALLPEPPEPAHAAHAVDAIVGAAHAHAGRLILVATGPLTNIALAVMREPELPRLLKRFVIMGGAYREPGNVTPCAEFNVWHDPEAARIVFRAFGGPGGTPVVAIGLDVTHQTTIDSTDLATLRTRSEGRPLAPALTRFIEDASRYYFDRMEKRRGTRILIMHDPLALAVALEPTLVATRRVAVDVETAGRLTTGATIADWRESWGRLANSEVAITVDAGRFRKMFFDAMVRLAAGAGGNP
ncbi:MAG TPA: nucleoside hydrolase [Roseiarcus sp.]|jgi:purine nucleosidase|nr:nucleoside hydrolase [Roseiarcus sp.]